MPWARRDRQGLLFLIKAAFRAQGRLRQLSANSWLYRIAVIPPINRLRGSARRGALLGGAIGHPAARPCLAIVEAVKLKSPGVIHAQEVAGAQCRRALARAAKSIMRRTDASVQGWLWKMGRPRTRARPRRHRLVE